MKKNIMQYYIDKFQNVVRKSCLPIWYDNEKNEPSLIATSFLCSYNGRYFFITAAHTFEDSEDVGRIYLVDDNNNKFYLRDYAASFVKVDFGLVVIDDTIRKRFSNISPVQIGISNNISFQEYEFIIFFGFPESKYNPVKKELHFTYVLCHKEERNTSDMYLYGEIKLKNIYKYKDGEFKIAKLPNLEGMSGGPAFYFSESLLTPIFAGVGVQKYKSDRTNKMHLTFINSLTVITCLDKALDQFAIL